MTQLDRLAARMSQFLGEPIVLPEDSEMYRAARVRTWSWPCPRCLAGDPMDVLLMPCSRDHSLMPGACECGDQRCLALLYQAFPYRPFTLDSRGRLWCHACGASEAQLTMAVRRAGGFY